MSEAEKISGKRKPGRAAVECPDENRFYGDVRLLEQIAEAAGIRKDTLKTFDGNREMTDAVMTLAVYLLRGQGTYNQLSSWQRIAKAPFSKHLTSPYIIKLTQMITEQNQIDLLKLRAARLKSHELCAVDSTSRSAWGDSPADIHYGRNKDHLSLPQTLEVVVYTLDGHMPVYYRTFAGNTPDSRSLETILHDLDAAGFKDVVLIADYAEEKTMPKFSFVA